MGNVVLSLYGEWEVYTVAGLLDVGDGVLTGLFLTADCILLYCHTAAIYPIISISPNVSYGVWGGNEVDDTYSCLGLVCWCVFGSEAEDHVREFPNMDPHSLARSYNYSSFGNSIVDQGNSL